MEKKQDQSNRWITDSNTSYCRHELGFINGGCLSCGFSCKNGVKRFNLFDKKIIKDNIDTSEEIHSET